MPVPQTEVLRVIGQPRSWLCLGAEGVVQKVPGRVVEVDVEIRGQHVRAFPRRRERSVEGVVEGRCRWVELDELLVDAVQQPGSQHHVADGLGGQDGCGGEDGDAEDKASSQ